MRDWIRWISENWLWIAALVGFLVDRLGCTETESHVNEDDETEHDMRAYLKVKIKTLAAEAAIIRREEKRFEKRVYLGCKYNSKADREEPRYKVVKNHPIRRGLQDHRKGPVRHEARLSQLAYAYLRRKDLLQTDEAAGRSFVRSSQTNTGLKTNLSFVRQNPHWAYLNSNDLIKIREMIERFGGDTRNFDAWTVGEWPEAE